MSGFSNQGITSTLSAHCPPGAHEEPIMSELDAEILAMSEVAAALDKLDNDSKRARVLRWATDRYGVTTTGP